MDHRIAYCGVDCAVCPDFLAGTCPDCRHTIWPENDACMPVACCRERGLRCCGQCPSLPCADMAAFYGESESHREAGARMRALAELSYVTLTARPELRDRAAAWFHDKWGVPESAYLACMDECLSAQCPYDWFLCLDGERIVGGMGVIENDFHDRKDLAPNVCAVFTEADWRGLGIAGRLLALTVDTLRARGVSPLYLVTDHTGFYERYGWEFLCMAQGDGEETETRMYMHR